MDTELGAAELPRMAAHEQSRYGAAAEYALRRYPGPVGELIHRELIAYARFGRHFSTDALIPHLMREVLTPPEVSAHNTDAAAEPPRVDVSTTYSSKSFLHAPGPDLWPRPNRVSRPGTNSTPP